MSICELRVSKWHNSDLLLMWKASENILKVRKGPKKERKQVSFFVFAINNFHCCVEAISTTQRRNSATRSKNQHVWKKPLKKTTEKQQYFTRSYQNIQKRRETSNCVKPVLASPTRRLDAWEHRTQHRSNMARLQTRWTKAWLTFQQHWWEKCIKIVVFCSILTLRLVLSQAAIWEKGERFLLETLQLQNIGGPLFSLPGHLVI